MNGKIAFSMALIIFLLSFTYFAVKVNRVKASGTIYIRADGSIEPVTANISSVDNVTYTFIGNMNDGIVIERNDAILDGDEYTRDKRDSSNTDRGFSSYTSKTIR